MTLWEITLKNGVRYWVGAADEEDAMVALLMSDFTADVVLDLQAGFSLTEHEAVDCVYHGDTGHPEPMRSAWVVRGSRAGVFACSEWTT